MIGDDPLKLLKNNLSRQTDQPVTDEEVDAFMSIPAVTPPGTVERVRSRFVAIVFEELYPKPVRRLGGNQTFGSWLESARERAKLTFEDLATALHTDEQRIERLENGRIQPWDLSYIEAADILILYRIHIEVITGLINSYFPEVKEDLILAFGMPASSSNNERRLMREERLEWLKALKKELQERQATDLLE